MGLAFLAALLLVRASVACPFCVAVQPTLAQERERCGDVVLAEFLERRGAEQVFRVHQSLKGDGFAADQSIALTDPAPRRPGQLALLFGVADDDGARQWRAVDADETVAGYFAKAPTLRVPAAERLRYFARYLEHSNPLIAEDAYLEFGHAPYDVVAQVADALESARLRTWLADEGIPQHRKGFYGLALGLPRGAEERAANRAFLEQQVLAPESDFRAGFDGLLAAYLLSGGEEALEVIERRMLVPADAPEGDTRHAVKAVRFYHEFGREIPPSRLVAAVRHLLTRPGFAAEAIADLARWQDWESLPGVVALYGVASPFQAATRRAVIGYLATCPLDEAAVALAKLRESDPEGVSQTLEQLGLSGS